MEYVVVVDITECADCGQSFQYSNIATLKGDLLPEPALCPECEAHQD